MHLLARSSVRIACPRDAAFAYAANLEHFAAWFPGVRHMASANNLPFDTVGKAYLETLAVPWGRSHRIPVRVVDVKAGVRIATEAQLSGLWPRMEISFVALDAAHCQVDWAMFSRSSGRVARWLMLPLARRVLAARASRGLQALQRQLQAGRAGAAT